MHIILTTWASSQEKFEDTKRGSQEPNDRQCNGHEKRDKRTNNTMAMRKETNGQTIQWLKRKMTKGETMIYNTLCWKLKIEQHKPRLKGRVSSYCSTCGTHHDTHVLLYGWYTGVRL